MERISFQIPKKVEFRLKNGILSNRVEQTCVPKFIQKMSNNF